mgnify:CR=1 FL=1|tara:strand:+ start:420 stop:545 length:126 start_codon:yes stop_codon:yes gene_type:complete
MENKYLIKLEEIKSKYPHLFYIKLNHDILNICSKAGIIFEM